MSQRCSIKICSWSEWSKQQHRSGEGSGPSWHGQGAWKGRSPCRICSFPSSFVEKKAWCVGIWPPHVKLLWFLPGKDILVELSRIYTLLSQAGTIRFQYLCGAGLVHGVDSSLSPLCFISSSPTCTWAGPEGWAPALQFPTALPPIAMEPIDGVFIPFSFAFLPVWLWCCGLIAAGGVLFGLGFRFI